MSHIAHFEPLKGLGRFDPFWDIEAMFDRLNRSMMRRAVARDG